jgi:hypothetical protein
LLALFSLGELSAYAQAAIEDGLRRRVVDGQGAVTFPVHVMQEFEDPRRLLMDL